MRGRIAIASRCKMATRGRLSIALASLMLISSGVVSLAQIVVPNAKRFTERDCRWLHKDFLEACAQSETCSSHPDELSYSMALQRGMSALETVITVAAMHEIEAACKQSCKSKHSLDYSTLRRTVCLPLMKR
jgi:hypothetical protein